MLLLLVSCSPSSDSGTNQQGPDLPAGHLYSPDGSIFVELEYNPSKGTLYSVTVDSVHQIIQPSLIGLILDEQDSTLDALGWAEYINFFDSFELESVERSTIDETWNPVWGQQAEIRNHCNELVAHLKQNRTGRKLDLFFRAYNDGVAFRFHIPATETWKQVAIETELTQFILGGDYKAWWIPQDFDSYEKDYHTGTVSQMVNANTPVTFQTDAGICLSIHEANLTNYPGMTLAKQTDWVESMQLNASLVPRPDSLAAVVSLPFSSPWRTIQIARTPAKLMESNLILNLNEPCAIPNTNWVEPMKYVGIWWGMHLGVNTWAKGPRHGATTKNCKSYIDFAAAHGIRGVLVEGWNTGWENWGAQDAFDYTTPYDDFDLEYLAAYAKEKGVALIGHHETGGDAEGYEARLDTIFAQCQKLGIKAVKTGYAGGIYPRGEHHHGQYMVNHYRKVLETAARYNIMIDAHEPIKPTGLERTWPNMMTREGVKGMEWNAWSAGNNPSHTCIIPFTRGLAGPVDYTPGIFDLTYENHSDREYWNNPAAMDTARVHSTLTKQLALFVVLYSPMTMAADLIESYQGHEAFEFIEMVPTTWDETIVLDGKIGEYVVVARRSGRDWYIAAITNEEPRVIEIDLATLGFLESGGDKFYDVSCYRDGEESDSRTNPGAYQIERSNRDIDGGIVFNLAAGGGAVSVWRPAW